MRSLKRLLQRLLVLALGMVTVWLIAFVFIDVAERRLPWCSPLPSHMALRPM